MKETERLEFKKSLASLEEIIETLVAFSNTAGGEIKIGFGDGHELVGVSIGKNTLENLSKQIAESTSPKLFPTISEEEADGRSTISIKIDEGLDKPYFCKGTAYKRVGRSNIKLDKNEIENLIIKKYQLGSNFDGETCTGASFEDLDQQTIDRFIDLSKGRIGHNQQNKNAKTILENLNLLRDGKLTNSAIILFGKNPQKFFPQYSVRCGFFKGQEIVDINLAEGNFFQMLDGAMSFITKYIKKRVHIEGLVRKEIFEYPENVIREAVVNSIVHRDIRNASSNYISIYEDRIEVKNPGLIPEQIKIEDLKKDDHPSIPRNKLIARTAYLAGYIEQWGTGTSKIVRLCRTEGLKEPEFSE
ncbi:putative DNA binding domain-containing protein, partial [Candidatus Micrarchaeota archaeon]|nr:putative DNA binding domain-containing protein [Candidatus Micrarchaeota archaeon]